MRQHFNLINPALRKRRDLFSAVPMALLLTLLIVALVISASVARSRTQTLQAAADQRDKDLQASQAQLLTVSQSLSSAQANPALVAELERAQAMLDLREEVIAALESGMFSDGMGFAEFMRGFARQVPGGMWLRAFVLNPAGKDMEIRGQMLNATALPEFIQRLKTEKVFQGLGFSSLQIEQPKEVAAAVAEANNATSAAEKSKAMKMPIYVEFLLRSHLADALKQGGGQ